MSGRFALVLRWRLKPGREADFVAAWDAVTLALLDQGSHGSALFEAADGTFHAVAFWPDVDARARAVASPTLSAAFAAMADAVEERLPPVELTERINRVLPVGMVG